jgi:transcriptional regulator with XRE-family HTH domain
MENRAIIAQALKAMRKDVNMTQEEVADLLGLWKTAISNLEKGSMMLGPDKWMALADIYEVDHKEMGLFLLRYTNPWLFGMIYGIDDPQLRSDIGLPPQRKKRGSGSDARSEANTTRARHETAEGTPASY